jgi:hypothetical protein
MSSKLDIVYMTYQSSDANESATGPRPETTEITSAMVRAAAGELAGFNRDYATIEEGARRILEAAMDAREI